MRWIGLTGGMGTGKSSVSSLLVSHNETVIDADAIVHELQVVGAEGYKQLVDHFGTSILRPDKKIDRQKLASIAFSSDEKKLELESLIHPLVRQRVSEIKSGEEAKGATRLFYDVPLLYEKSMEHEFDGVVVVYCSHGQQVERLLKKGFDRQDINRRLNIQLDIETKKQRADWVIDNSGDALHLKKNVQSFLFGLSHQAQE